MIRVYQIQLTNDQIDEINEHGHHAVPAQVAKLNVMFGASNFRPSDFKYYKETINVMKAKTLRGTRF